MRGTSLRALNVAFAVAVARGAGGDPVYVLARDRRVHAALGLRPRRDRPRRPRLGLRAGLPRPRAGARAVRGRRRRRAASSTVRSASSARWSSCSRSPAALAAGAAALLLPALAGHAGQKSPRGLALPLDVFHLGAVAVWLGGLIGLVVLWLSVSRAGRSAVLAYVVPRFSAVAFCSVLLLIGTGTGQALLELPTLASLWQTSYGQALLWKIGLLARGARARRREPRRGRSRGSRPATPRRRCCSGASCRARSSSSWPRCSPPPCSRASRRPRARSPRCRTSPPASGPGPVATTVVASRRTRCACG